MAGGRRPGQACRCRCRRDDVVYAVQDLVGEGDVEAGEQIGRGCAREGDADGAGARGVGTLYRAFPQRAELVVAVLQREIDACADAAPALAAARRVPRRGARGPGSAAHRSSLRRSTGSGPRCTAKLRPSRAWRATSGSGSGPPSGQLLETAAASGEIRARQSARGSSVRRRQPVPARAGRRRRLQPAYGRALGGRPPLRREMHM